MEHVGGKRLLIIKHIGHKLAKLLIHGGLVLCNHLHGGIKLLLEVGIVLLNHFEYVSCRSRG